MYWRCGTDTMTAYKVSWLYTKCIGGSQKRCDDHRESSKWCENHLVSGFILDSYSNFSNFLCEKIINESCLTQCWIDTAIIILYIIVMNLDVFAKWTVVKTGCSESQQ